MSKILLLTKIFLKSSIQFNYNIKDKNEKDNKKIKRTLLQAVVFIYIMSIFGFLSYNLINTLIKFQQETLFIGFYLLAVIALVIVQTVFAGLNLFYFSKDIEYVLPLPVKPIHLVVAKTNVLLITEYFTEIIFALSPLIIYGVLTGAGFLYYVFSILVLLIIPILPVILIMFVVMLLMSVSNLVKYKERFQLIVNIVIIGLAVGAQFVMGSLNNPTEEALVQSITTANGLVNMIGNYFITLKPGIDAIISTNVMENIFALCKIILITGVATVFYYIVGQKLYLKGVVGTSSTATKKLKNIEKYFLKRNIFESYLSKEFKLLVRNPVYLVQCILPAILMPLIILGSLWSVVNSETEGMDITQLNVESAMGICIVLCALNFLYSMNFISVTAISRDGNNAMFVKYIPVDLYKQFLYKMMPNFIINIIPIVFVIFMSIFIFKASIIYIICLTILALLTNLIQSLLMLIVDLKRPKLNWNNEYAVVKQNMNMIFEFALMFFIIIIAIGIGYLTMNLNYIIPVAILTIIFTLGSVLINYYVKKNKNQLFEKIM